MLWAAGIYVWIFPVITTESSSFICTRYLQVIFNVTVYMYCICISGSRKSSRNLLASENFEHDASACLICSQLKRQDLSQSEIEEGGANKYMYQ